MHSHSSTTAYLATCDVGRVRLLAHSIGGKSTDRRKQRTDSLLLVIWGVFLGYNYFASFSRSDVPPVNHSTPTGDWIRRPNGR